MKRCPRCRRDYFDDSLLYCLDDGTALLEGPSSHEPRTAILTDTSRVTPVMTGEQTRVFESTHDTNGHETHALPATAPKKTRQRTLTLMVAGLAALLLGGAGFGVYKYTQSKPPLSFQSAEFVRLTSTGNAWGVALSPDGKYVAHLQDEGGRRSLWVRQVATASNMQLVEPSSAIHRGLTFSPDSNFIYYSVDDTGDQKGTLYRIPTLGGQSRKILTGIASSVTFSPDGKQIAFFRTTTVEDARDDALIIANDNGSGERILASRRGNERFYRGSFSSPSWSPDGKRIACPIGSLTDNEMSVATVSVATGEVTTVTPDRWFVVRQVAWMDDDRILFNAGTSAGTQFRIWQVSASTGEVHRVTNDSINYRVFSLNTTSDSLAVIQGSGTANISVAPVGEPGKSTPVTQGLSFNADSAWTVDDRLVYASDAAGSVHLFLSDLRGGAPTQLTSEAGTNRLPRVTPDGRYIVLCPTERAAQTSGGWTWTAEIRFS